MCSSPKVQISLLSSLVLVLLAGPSLGRASEAPEQEAKIHEIYQKYHSAPTDEVSWGAAQRKAKGHSYKVQSGDNLWNLSQMLFGDPQFWPKVWSLNSQQITNPHEINIGGQIAFQLGNSTEPPQVQIMADEPMAVPANGEAAPEQKNSMEAAEMQFYMKQNLELPPPTKVYPPIKPIPNSIPEWKYRGVPESISEADFNRDRKRLQEDRLALPFSITAKKSSGVGVIFEMQQFGEFAVENQTVLVRIAKNETRQKFTVIEFGNVIYDPFHKRSFYERKHLGEIKLQALVNPRLNIYRASVLKSLAPLTKGAILIPGDLPMHPDPIVDSIAVDDDVRIMGGPLSPQKHIMGDLNYVFVSGGSRKGLKVGQVFEIERFSPVRNERTFIETDDERISKLILVQVENSASTAYVLSTNEEIMIGDRIVVPRKNEDASADEFSKAPAEEPAVQ